VELPKRTKQQRAESESYAILLYKLRRLGIFRNLTENDYGIDFEIELVSEEGVSGRYFKAQVKSSENLFIRKSDGAPTVGGIKDSTLNYWCELSYHTHVIAYAVDLSTEQIYVSRALFWQAARLIDGSTSTKTIEFLPPPATLPTGTISAEDAVATRSIAIALSPSVGDVIYALTTAFRSLEDFCELRVDAFHYDQMSEVDRPVLFRSFLEVCSILLCGRDSDVPLPDEDKKAMYVFDHWATKRDPYSTEVAWIDIQDLMEALLPMLITTLCHYKKMVIEGQYYWKYKNPQFLRLATNTRLPPGTDKKTLDDWGYKKF
jgi:hypothetical protein